METLILSCGTGGGHNSAARAILEEVQRRGDKAVLLNPYTLYSIKLAQTIDTSYISMVQKRPRLFGAMYRAGQLYRSLPVRSPVYHVNRWMVPIMEEYLRQNHFDIVITTHLYPAEIMTNLQDRGAAVPKTIFVSTDYVCIPFTEETECDAYVIPAKDLAPDYVRRGIPAEKLYPLGIPTKAAFAGGETKAEARRRLHLDPDKRYALVAGGSMGGGTIRQTIRALMEILSGSPDTVLILVCGNNRNLYEELAPHARDNILVVGHTDDMAGYLRASDLFVTKPGGLSSTEAAVCGIPILHTAGIPGCETYNADYFSAHGMSVACQDPQEAAARAAALLADPEQCAEMVRRQHERFDGGAAGRICDFARQMVTGAER